MTISILFAVDAERSGARSDDGKCTQQAACDPWDEKLPFAGYSVEPRERGFHLRQTKTSSAAESALYKIVWDDPPPPPGGCGATARFRGPAAPKLRKGAKAGPQATISPFPVVIGEGSHPFPFRTRKLSPLPPMVLRAKVRGRVGHCRDYFAAR